MKHTPAPSETWVLHAAAASLVAALACVALFLPPLLDDTIATPLRAAATGAALGVTLLLHWIFLGMAARRLQRSVPAWVGLSVLVFPMGSVLSLVLLGWFADASAPGRGQPQAAAQG
ncbi:MAG: hypothetical protein KA711_15155 [Ideonella sp. WA131b]|jgi:hypothetical protein|nr:hypothetical protein [Ideonella sp. WA131b]